MLPPIFKKRIVNKEELKKKAKDKLVDDRVVSFKKIKNNLIEVITEKKTYICKKLILCSGPIGNAFILLRSFKKINYLKFKDDNPRMIFGLNFGKKKYLINKQDKLVNFDIIQNNKLLAYTTIYNIDPNHFNKFFRPIISFFRNFLRMFFFYGQFWVSDEYNEIKLTRSNSNLTLTAQTINPKGPKKPDDPFQPYLKQKVMRGGSFLCNDSYCSGYRVASRMKSSPDTGLQHTGFRLVKD